jgi:hypothetical protein
MCHFSIRSRPAGVHPASHTMGTSDYVPGDKAAGRENDKSPPLGAEVNNGGAMLIQPHMSSLREL